MRRGFLLLEFAIALSVLTALAALAVMVVRAASVAQQHALQQLSASRTGMVLTALLRDNLAHAETGDVTGDSLRARWPRLVGAGVSCDTAANTVTVGDADYSGTRWPEAGRDRVLALVDADQGTWIPDSIVAVGLAWCPDASHAHRLTLGSITGVLAVRVVESVEVRLYRSGGSAWLGLAPADGHTAVQPFAGPVTGSSRFAVSADKLEAAIEALGGSPLLLTIPLHQP